MAQQSSRLNRLLTLLDSGSTQATRFTAARQIGDIAKSHPEDLDSLLTKISLYLRSKNWDTRVAAAHAIGAIAGNIKHASLSELWSCVEKKMSEVGIAGVLEDVITWHDFDPNIAIGISFKSFDMNKVLEFGALLASGGQEYDVVNDSTKNPRERLARQKQNLRRRLGLDMCEQFMDVNDMIRDEDLNEHNFHSHGNGMPHQFHIQNSARNVRQFVANMVPSYRSRRPSARELNLLKRKAKIGSKDQTKAWSKDGETEATNSQGTVLPRGLCPDASSSSKLFSDPVLDEDNFELAGDGEWPFHTFVEQLMVDMFDPVWEVRHGSVMALREILSQQGPCVGVVTSDLGADGQLLSCTKNMVDVTTIKRKADIDFSLQLPAEQTMPLPKKPKIEESATAVRIEESATALKIEELETAVKIEESVSAVKIEDTGSDPLPSHINGEPNVDFVNLNLPSFVDDRGVSFINETKDSSEDKYHVKKVDILKSLPENSELINLVRVTRHSWLKNCDVLQDCTIRFLCVLSLDRFGDYVSDQVVAPIRETCAQALGAVLKCGHPKLVHETLNVLLQMQRRPEWEIRHGSLLGIKYLVAVRQEMLRDLLVSVLPACKAGLEDPDDDVRAVAADALIPTAAAIVSLKGQTLHSIVMLLWDILLDLDDLSPSTSSVMNLLAEIYSQEEMIPKMSGRHASKEKLEFDLNEMVGIDDLGEEMGSQENPYVLSVLAPRLWPFMRHNITSVRYSAIRTLERLLEAGCRKCVSSESSFTCVWPSSILGDTLRIVFQNLLLESNKDILQCSEKVWRLLLQCPVKDLEDAAKLYISSWVELAGTPYGSPLDASKMFWPVTLPRKSHFKAAAKLRAVKLENDSYCMKGGMGCLEAASNLSERGGDPYTTPIKIVVGADADMSVTHTRVVTSTALGIFISKMQSVSLQHVVDPLWKAVTSLSGVQRQVASMILISWFKENRVRNCSGSTDLLSTVSTNFKNWLLDLLGCSDPAFPTKNSRLPYIELSKTYAKMHNEAGQLFSAVESSGLCHDFLLASKLDPQTLSADDAITFASRLPLLKNELAGEEFVRGNAGDELESLKQRLLGTSGYLKCVQGNLHVTVSSLVAAAVVWMSELPAKLNPIILPLMASIKREKEEILQNKAAEALAELMFHCITRKPSPNDKLLKNLCSLTCVDPCETPQALALSSVDSIDEHNLLSSGCNTYKQKSKVPVPSSEDLLRAEGFVSRRGSELALKHLCEKFGDALFDKLPKIWDCLTEVIKPASLDCPSSDDEMRLTLVIEAAKDPQTLINNIQVVRSIGPMLDAKLRPKLLTLLPCIFRCVCHMHIAVRLAASRCITSMAKSMTLYMMGAVIENVIPMLGDLTSVHARQGAGMLVSLLVQGLGVELVPYAPLLVVPLLRCMSDSDKSVRQSVTHSFAALVPLLPLARGVSPPVKLSDALLRSTEDARFLEQLVDNSHIDDYKLPIELQVTLRRYQQEGINWLAFLKRFNLHGILCDDMGLGKTLQASAIVASDIAEFRAINNGKDPLASLIVCPSTLVGHWVYEIEKFMDASVLTTLQYVGSTQERTSLRSQIDKHNVIITSYDMVRKDVDYLGQLSWNFCILDEGHIIKNAKSKITCAVKQLKAQHRLILSGTPIQNNVLDLWSLFDFLMPGFLGTERQFNTTYGKPLVAARDAKSSAKEAEAGVLAMEALHKQVMPFLLRRTKDEVLSDLPDKIIQDRYCNLSPVQLKLYEQFSGSHVKDEISDIVKLDELDKGEESASPRASVHVFQALQYLLKLCSHPVLVTGEKISDSFLHHLLELFPANCDIISELHRLHHSPKLVALREILEECGIGVDAMISEGSVSVGQHRVLIFAQHKAFLDIIERDLFLAHMKSVTYLRLDGSVEPSKRFEIVKAFNSDPTIDALLLTTHVGGLGLNLTSADTLIFMEHDWNPMRDLQAMDRAHRLGQKKVVNVHRLIMRGTLEEKVMSLQKFKLSVANAVINAENSSLKTMNTDQLLDLFKPAENEKGASGGAKNQEGDMKLAGTGKGLKAILGGLEELWDQSQYTEEYNLNQFLAKLNG